MSVEFAQFTEAESDHVFRIIRRAQKLDSELCGPAMTLELEMDLSATHAKTPLDLEALADADDFNLLHDVLGIRMNLNRQTGELESHFLPRCVQKESEGGEE